MAFCPRRLDLAAVEASLRRLQRDLGPDADRRDVGRDPLGDRVVDNLVEAYAYVDRLLADGVDLFAFGNLRHLLEINTLVLCGSSADRRSRYGGHIDATELRFYDERDAGIQDVMEWYARHAGDSVWHVAAGVHLRMLSKPQLFIEGNNRSGALVMSYLLARGGQPPFVLDADSAASFFALGAEIRDMDKRSPAMLFRLPAVRDRLVSLLVARSDRRYLLECAPSSGQ